MCSFLFCIIIDKTVNDNDDLCGGDDLYGYDEEEDDDDDDVDKPSPRVRGHMSTCHTPAVNLIDFTTLPSSIQCNSI